MPEILPEQVPSPQTPLVWDGTRYRAVRGHTDGTVQVRGEDQLFSFGGVLVNTRSAAISHANGWVESNPVPADTIWHVTHVWVWDGTSPTTAHQIALFHDGASFPFHRETAAFAAAQASEFKCDIWMDPDDVLRVSFIGGLVGDTCSVRVLGHTMTLET